MVNQNLAFIVDDHYVIIDGIRPYLTEKFTEIQSFTNGLEVIDALKNTQPDLLILDLNLPGKNGMEVLKFMSEHQITSRIIILTMYNERSLVEKCKALGAHAYLLKNSSNEDLQNAIESESFTYGIGVRGSNDTTEFEDKFLETMELTRREIEVIQLLAKDFSSEEIANKLFVSPHTISTHRRNLKRKLKASTSAGIVAIAYENNLIN
jgi:DNA-binding NarL/FixJ family response regulator